MTGGGSTGSTPGVKSTRTSGRRMPWYTCHHLAGTGLLFECTRPIRYSRLGSQHFPQCMTWYSMICFPEIRSEKTYVYMLLIKVHSYKIQNLGGTLFVVFLLCEGWLSDRVGTLILRSTFFISIILCYWIAFL